MERIVDRARKNTVTDAFAPLKTKDTGNRTPYIFGDFDAYKLQLNSINMTNIMYK